MRKKVLLFLLIPLLFSNCTNKEVVRKDLYEDKYNTQPGTGMLYGKFAVDEKWAKVYHYWYYFLMDKEAYLTLLQKWYDIQRWRRKLNLDDKLKWNDIEKWYEGSFDYSKYDSVSIKDSLLIIKNITPGDYVMLMRAKAFGDKRDRFTKGGALLPLSKYCDRILIPIKKDSITLFTNIEVVPGEVLIVDPEMSMDVKHGDYSILNTCSPSLKIIQLNDDNYLNLVKRR